MSIANEIRRLTSAKAAIKTSINAKNKSTNQITDETLDEYSAYIDLIQTRDPDYPEDWIQLDSAENMGDEEIQCIVRSDMPFGVRLASGSGSGSSQNAYIYVKVTGADPDSTFTAYYTDSNGSDLVGEYQYGEEFKVEFAKYAGQYNRIGLKFNENDGTPCSGGYNTLKVSLYMKTGQDTDGHIESFCYDGFLPSALDSTMHPSSNWLAVRVKSLSTKYYSIISATAVSNLYSSPQYEVCHNYLEYFDMKNVNRCSGTTNAFRNCYKMKKLELPESYNISYINQVTACYSLEEIVNLDSISFGSSGHFTSYSINSLNSLKINADLFSTKVLSWDSGSILSEFRSMYGTLIIKGANAITSLQNNYCLEHIIYSDEVSNFGSGISILNSYSLKDVTLPLKECNVTSISISSCPSLEKLNIIDDDTGDYFYTESPISISITNAIMLKSIDLSNLLLKRLSLSGNNQRFCNLSSLTISDSTEQFTGSSPQIDISYQSMGRAALVDLFGQLPDFSSSTTTKSIKITACVGVSELTADDKKIATDKGWTIII